MFKRVFISLPLVLSSFCTHPAFAQVGNWVYWQANGGGCVPTDATIQSRQHFTATQGGRVKYRGNSTAPLEFSCPVTNFNSNAQSGDGTVLKLFYQDPDGPGSAFKVEAKLMAFAKNNGALNAIARVTSNAAGQWQKSEAVIQNHSFNFNANLYWMHVIITRSQPSNLVVEFNGVSIEGAIF